MSIKDYLIKLLGGYTSLEYENSLSYIRENELINKLNREEIHILKDFIFYIGDYLHNFNPEVPLNTDTYIKFQRLLTLTRNTRNFDISKLNDILELVEASETLKEDVLTHFKHFPYDYLKEKLYYQLVILGFRQILPYITNGFYSFKDTSPCDVEELQNMNYMLK